MIPGGAAAVVVAVGLNNLVTLQTSTAEDPASRGSTLLHLVQAPKLPYIKQVPAPARPASPTRICSYLPVPSLTSQPPAAEILVLDPDPSQVTLGVMP